VELPLCDIDPASGGARLSYRQAEDLFKALARWQEQHDPCAAGVMIAFSMLGTRG
jgi:hypothetical protein